MSNRHEAKGDLAKLVREIGGSKVTDGQRLGELLQRVNGRFPDHVHKALDTFSVAQTERLGLGIVAGKLVSSLATLPTEKMTSSGSTLSAPLELVKLIRLDLAGGSEAAVDKRLALHMSGYNRRLTPADAVTALSKASGAAERIAVIRSSPSVTNASVGTMVHAGAFLAENSGYEGISKRAGKLLNALAAPEVQTRERFQIERYERPSMMAFALKWYDPAPPISTDAPDRVLTLELAQNWGKVVASGGVMESLSTGQAYLSPDREFCLSTTSHFVVSQEILELMDGRPSADQPLQLSTDESLIMSDFVAKHDATVIAPAVTTFKASQTLLLADR